MRLVGVLDRRQAGQAAEPGEILGDVDRVDARHGAAVVEIADGEARVRVRAAHEGGLQFAPPRHASDA